jgi:hypothetical protein
VPDDDGSNVEYYSCPMLFIGESVREWHELYGYIERYPHTAPPYYGQSPRYLEFTRYFLGKKLEFEAAMRHGGEVR